MKQRIIIIIYLALLINISYAQTNSRNSSSTNSTTWTSKPTDIATVTEAKNIIATIISAIGLKQNFEVMSADVPNAVAVIYQNKRYILYNPDFINQLNAKAGNKWAAISILAHEIGHHLNGHTLDNLGSRPDLELEADEFSGFVLRKLGATLSEAQEAMRIAADYKSSDTHPAQQLRLNAIATGWNNAGNAAIGKDIAKNSPASTNRQAVKQPQIAVPEQTVYNQNDNRRSQQSQAALLVNNTNAGNGNDQRTTSDKLILADISFAADQSSFYVTTHYKVVKLVNNQFYIIGKMLATDSSEYPFIITDENGTRLWVDSKGNILNTNDRKVGVLTAHS